jgi:hypothetical protein
MRSDPIETAIKALLIHYPDSIGGFVSGSIVRSDSTSTSDIDIAVLYDESFDDIHRFSTTVDEWPIEFFVHNQKAQNFYFEKDRLRGMCVMPDIVGSGIIVPSEAKLLLNQQAIALEIIERGPPILTTEMMALRRYTITDLVDDLIGASDIGHRNAILGQLLNRLGDFYLRSQNKWSGEGKALVRILGDVDMAFRDDFVDSFSVAFSSNLNDEILNLAKMILEPYGGYLRNGYFSSAPNDWKMLD